MRHTPSPGAKRSSFADLRSRAAVGQMPIGGEAALAIRKESTLLANLR
jgi:hypothetical protein